MADNEADFRQRLTRALRPVFVVCEYMSSMNRKGIPDVHVVTDDGRACWLELKFVDQWPVGDSANVLGHRFSPPQLAFLRRVERAGGLGLGVIGYRLPGDDRRHAAFAATSDIGDDGSLTRAGLLSLASLDVRDPFFARRVETMLSRA